MVALRRVFLAFRERERKRLHHIRLYHERACAHVRLLFAFSFGANVARVITPIIAFLGCA